MKSKSVMKNKEEKTVLGTYPLKATKEWFKNNYKRFNHKSPTAFASEVLNEFVNKQQKKQDK